MKFKEYIAENRARALRLIATNDQERMEGRSWLRDASSAEALQVMLYIHDMVNRPHSHPDYMVGKLANLAIGALMTDLIKEIERESAER